MAVNSFSSLSLDPPLVLFCPAASSTSWPGIREAGRFAVNILSSDHAEVIRQFSRSGGDKFEGIEIRNNEYAVPVIEGSVAHLICDVDALYPGGDHHIVVGRVLHAERQDDGHPIMFHRGRTIAFG
nr:flavin reductase family protein [Rhodococcus fascians]